MSKSTGVPSKAYPILSRIRGSKEVITLIKHLRKFDDSDIAKERLRIIKFYEVHGERACRDAFGVGRGTIHVWKRKLRGSKGNISSLVPQSTKPGNVRRMTTDPSIVEFITKIRRQHPRLGKEKIYPLLVEYCKEIGINPIKESTIGKVIKKKNLFFQRKGRIYHNPNYNYKAKRKVKRLRVRYSPKHTELGHIQADTVVKIVDG